MRKLIISFAIAVFGVVGLASVPQPAGAINLFKNCTSGTVCTEANSSKSQAGTMAQNIISILLYAVGIISVIMIIVGGIKYATSNGDSSKMTSAKNTILYAVVGLVVAIMAYAIVNFAIAWITKK